MANGLLTTAPQTAYPSRTGAARPRTGASSIRTILVPVFQKKLPRILSAVRSRFGPRLSTIILSTASFGPAPQQLVRFGGPGLVSTETCLRFRLDCRKCGTACKREASMAPPSHNSGASSGPPSNAPHCRCICDERLQKPKIGLYRCSYAKIRGVPIKTALSERSTWHEDCLRRCGCKSPGSSPLPITA